MSDSDEVFLDEVFLKVRQIIAQQAMLEPEQVDSEASLKDLGLDSLALVEIVFAIEEAFDISVPYNANDAAHPDFDISTLSAAAAAIRRLLAEKA